MKFSESQEAIFRSRLQTIISPDCPARSDSRSVFKSDFGERESRSEFRVRSAPYPGQWPANKPADATQLQEAGSGSRIDADVIEIAHQPRLASALSMRSFKGGQSEKES